MSAFWFAIIWIGIPLVLVSVTVANVQAYRTMSGQPELEGRVLFHADVVRARSSVT